MLRLIILTSAALWAQPPASPHEPTPNELKLEIATLKQQLLQAKAQILQYQFQQVQAEREAAEKAVSAQEKAKPGK
jgi:hypothetical protein